MEQAKQPAVAVGQVWKDNDPRVTRRHLKVLQVNGSRAQIQRCSIDGALLSLRPTWAQLSRFNGRQQGYSIVSEAQ